jgi:DNA polymerase V
MPENPNFAPIKVTEENELIIWGIVTHVLKAL